MFIFFNIKIDPDPFTHMKKSEGADDVDLSFLKELEQEDKQQIGNKSKEVKK